MLKHPLSAFLSFAVCACGPAGPSGPNELPRADFPTPRGSHNFAYRELDGWAVVDGDLLFPLPDQQQSSARALTIAGATRSRLLARWPGGVIPYDDQLPATDTRVEEAIAAWEAATDVVTFVEWDGSATDYVTIQAGAPGTHCLSSVGFVGGQQFITLDPACTWGNTMHEFGHTIGLWHEHNRSDRDDHVIINEANIDPSNLGAFTRYDEALLDGQNAGKYDHDSIMHYGSTQFSNNGLPSITKLSGALIVENRTAPTDTDVCAVKRYYGQGGRSDFNGDGYDDLAVGIPGEDIAKNGQGAIVVSYGSATGLQGGGQYLHRDAIGVDGDSGDGHLFGSVLAVGDFNADCYDDLAVGVPQDDVNGLLDAGTVHIFYGSVLGLGDNIIFHADGTNVAGTAEAFAQFGASLAAGDFDGDGRDDLAVGAPYRDVNGVVNAGSVTILFGKNTGLSGTNSIELHQNYGTIPDSNEANDNFGRSLAAGDFKVDGFVDLAIGAPGEDLTNAIDAGAVTVLWGALAGFGDIGTQLTQANFGGVSEASDLFAWALAAGDFDGDGYKDLAVGVPYEDSAGGVVNSGEVDVIYGAYTGLVLSPQIWSQDSTGISGTAQTSDLFGRVLVAGDFNGDHTDDLAIGVPYDDVGSATDAGVVNIIPGSETGLTSTGSLWQHQDMTGVADLSESSDFFGYALAAGDFDRDGYTDLVVGVPYEDSPGADVGAVHFFPGSSTGPSVTGDLLLQQSALSNGAVSEVGDLFGLAL